MTSISQLRIVNNLTNNKNELSVKLKCDRINGTVRGRLGRMIPKNWKAVLASYPASCFGDIGCKRKFHTPCCHWLAAFSM